MVIIGGAVDKGIEALESYLYDVLHIQVKAKLWKGQGELPFFLTDFYTFYETKLLESVCIFMIAKEHADVTPTMIKKHWKKIKRLTL